MSANEINAIVEAVQDKTGYIFEKDEVSDVYAYTVRKCEINGKGDDYVPILFENELRDYLARLVINAKGYLNYVRRMQNESMSPSMP